MQTTEQDDPEVAKTKNIFPEHKTEGNAIEITISKDASATKPDLYIPNVRVCQDAGQPQGSH